jgi:hypothetical protein
MAESYIGKPLELSPDKIREVGADKVEIIIVHKFSDGSEAEFRGLYKEGRQQYYSTEITNAKSSVHRSDSRVDDLLKDLY